MRIFLTGIVPPLDDKTAKEMEQLWYSLPPDSRKREFLTLAERRALWTASMFFCAGLCMIELSIAALIVQIIA